jgi:hypothetical protein
MRPDPFSPFAFVPCPYYRPRVFEKVRQFERKRWPLSSGSRRFFSRYDKRYRCPCPLCMPDPEERERYWRED